MKKITLKSAALLFALVFALACLTACGGSKGKLAAKTTTEATATEVTTTEATTEKTLENWWNENTEEAGVIFSALEAAGINISAKDNSMYFTMNIEKLVDESTLEALEKLDRETIKSTFESQMDSIGTSVKSTYDSIKTVTGITDIKMVVEIYYGGELLCSTEVAN